MDATGCRKFGHEGFKTGVECVKVLRNIFTFIVRVGSRLVLFFALDIFELRLIGISD